MQQIIDFILQTVWSLWYIGIFIMMTIEASFIPFPSELILIPAWNLVSLWQMNFILLILASTLWSIAWSSVNYILGYYFWAPIIKSVIHNYGKYIGLKEKHYTNSESFFLKHWEISTFVGRFLPGVRSLISFPPGVFRMNLVKFALYTWFSASIANTLLISVGYFAWENKELLEKYSKEILILSLIFIWIITLVYIWIQKKKK